MHSATLPECSVRFVTKYAIVMNNVRHGNAFNIALIVHSVVF